jgi:hypothetical protein
MRRSIIAGHRLMLNFQLYHESLPNKFSSLNMNDISDVKTLFGMLLPPIITNGIGIPEEPLAYIFRHTQLLPRHFLIYLNKIITQSAKRQSILSGLSEKCIIEGIQKTENLVAREVLNAFEHRYITAKEVCEKVIPELPFHFTRGELQRVFNIRGKAAMGTDDFYSFLRMLVEIGAIGRVFSKSERYIKGRFEYTSPYKLGISSADTLCLHPVFAGVFQAQISDPRVAVMPYGASMDDADYRDF